MPKVLQKPDRLCSCKQGCDGVPNVLDENQYKKHSKYRKNDIIENLAARLGKSVTSFNPFKKKKKRGRLLGS